LARENIMGQTEGRRAAATSGDSGNFAGFGPKANRIPLLPQPPAAKELKPAIWMDPTNSAKPPNLDYKNCKLGKNEREPIHVFSRLFFL
jgi:hypothetical protein